MAENQYVVFKLGNEEFGIEIMNVQEIVPYEKSIHVPNTPEFIEGIINHRGTVIPIVNLKKRLNLKVEENTEDTRIIIIKLDNKEVGFVVDEASQTLRLSGEDIDQAPDIVTGIDKRYIIGVGKIDDSRLLILLDLQKILTDDEIKEIKTFEGTDI